MKKLSLFNLIDKIIVRLNLFNHSVVTRNLFILILVKKIASKDNILLAIYNIDFNYPLRCCCHFSCKFTNSW